MLEKRVKSRCQSQVYQIAPSNTWDVYRKLLVQALTAETGNAGLDRAWADTVDVRLPLLHLHPDIMLKLRCCRLS